MSWSELHQQGFFRTVVRFLILQQRPSAPSAWELVKIDQQGGKQLVCHCLWRSGKKNSNPFCSFHAQPPGTIYGQGGAPLPKERRHEDDLIFQPENKIKLLIDSGCQCNQPIATTIQVATWNNNSPLDVRVGMSPSTSTLIFFRCLYFTQIFIFQMALLLHSMFCTQKSALSTSYIGTKYICSIVLKLLHEVEVVASWTMLVCSSCFSLFFLVLGVNSEYILSTRKIIEVQDNFLLEWKFSFCLWRGIFLLLFLVQTIN